MVTFAEIALTGGFTGFVVPEDPVALPVVLLVVPLVQVCPVQAIVTSVSVVLTCAPKIFAAVAFGGVGVDVIMALSAVGVVSPAMYIAGSVGVSTDVPAVAVPDPGTEEQPHAQINTTTKRHAAVPSLYIFLFHLL